MKLYQFHIPQRYIAKIDELVREEEYANRSDFVTKAISEKLERETIKFPPEELDKEELREKIQEALLELWEIPNQPFLEAVEEIMGTDYWDERVSMFLDTLDEIENRDVLLGILVRMRELRERSKWGSK